MNAVNNYFTRHVNPRASRRSEPRFPDFARRFQEAERQRGVRPGELAELLATSAGTVSTWRNGHRKPDESYFTRLVKELGVTRSWLEHGEGPMRPGAPRGESDGEPGVSGVGLSLGERAELPPEAARAARRLVDAFKREAAIAGATSEELHYIETVLMTPNLPPTLAGGDVPPEQLLEHIQAMMDPLRVLLRKLGRSI